MPLSVGTRFGPYEIAGPLGAGGMGEVYRARDPKLSRDVAVKILPEPFARDPERLARFRREAQLLASLNHPNIGAIYGFEESNGVGALVLELVEGPTLADRIARGAVPLDEALPIARQITEACEAAHAQGIIHRDLKPSNVKLRPDGVVKVLDFGLARATDASPAGANASQSPTITSPSMTRAGVIMGTASYMSPEQAKGRFADKRSDIWAFGCVLFEMLTGRRTFDGEDVAETLANILTKEPAWGLLPPATPPSIRRVLLRCLQRDRGESAMMGGDWNRDDIILFTHTDQTLAQVGAAGGTPSSVTAIEAGGDDARHMFPFLPDGRQFVYVARGFGEQFAVYISSLDSQERTRLPVASPFVQYANGRLLFTRGNALVAQRFDQRRQALVGDAVSIAEQLRTDYNYNQLARYFSVSGVGMLVIQEDPSPGNNLVWYDREGRVMGTLGDAAGYGDVKISPDGQRVSTSVLEPDLANRDLWIFDVARGTRTRFTSGPAPEAHNVWSPDGERIVFDSNRKGHRDIYVKASNGVGAESLLLEDEFDSNPTAWSPDGRFILYIRRSPALDGWVLPLDGESKPFPFLESSSNEWPMGFSPDGRWVVYFSDESGRTEVYVSPFPGPGGKTQVSTRGGFNARWSGDGREIFYQSHDGKLMAAAVSADGDRFHVGEVKALFELPAVGPRGAYDVSPDSQRFLAVTVRPEVASTPLTLVTNWPALASQ